VRDRYRLGNLGVDGKIILKWTFKKYYLRAQIELVCLRTETSNRLL